MRRESTASLCAQHDQRSTVRNGRDESSVWKSLREHESYRRAQGSRGWCDPRCDTKIVGPNPYMLILSLITSTKLATDRSSSSRPMARLRMDDTEYEGIWN